MNFAKRLIPVCALMFLAALPAGFCFAQGLDSKVHFLFQSAVDKNKTYLVRQNSVNIVYISSDCERCFQQISSIAKFKSPSNFIVVTAGRNWNHIRTLSSGLSNKNFVYYDPGQRFKTAAKVETTEGSFLRVSDGKITKKQDFSFRGAIPDPYKLQIWQ